MTFNLPPTLPDRIWIIGPSGAGKSTFARSLADSTRLPLVHLDQHYWQPGWTTPSEDDWKARARQLAAQPRWITEGNYQSTATDRRDRVQLVIHLDLPRWRYVWRVIKRIATTYGVVRDDMADGCPEQIDWEFAKFVWTFPRNRRPLLLGIMENLREDQWGVTAKTPAEVAALLVALKALPRD